ncbi:MAG: flippase-like domain-containing protein [Chloroflexi bacterium]|nr:MAG: flippase-like domain-containing protein [Chloroflexota bacterium]
MSHAWLRRWQSLRRRRLLALLIGLAIAAAVVWVSHPASIWHSLQEVDTMPILVALLLNIPIVALRAIRAQVILGFLGHRVSFRSMVPVQLVGQTSSTITPAASGDYVRAYIWRRTHTIPVRDGAAVVTFERVYSLYLLVAVALLLIILPRHGFIGWVGVAAGLIAATMAPVVVELMAPPALERWALTRITSGRFLSRFAEGAFEMVDNLRNLLRSPVLLAETSAITLVIFAVSAFQLLLLLDSLGDTIRITQAVAVYATSQVGGILSTLPFGLGASDAILVTVLAGYSVSVADSASAAVLARAVSTLPLALAGLIAYMRLDGQASSDPAPVATSEGE